MNYAASRQALQVEVVAENVIQSISRPHPKQSGEIEAYGFSLLTLFSSLNWLIDWT